jgi:hypothetical protein
MLSIQNPLPYFTLCSSHWILLSSKITREHVRTHLDWAVVNLWRKISAKYLYVRDTCARVRIGMWAYVKWMHDYDHRTINTRFDTPLKISSMMRWREVRKKPCTSQWRREDNLQIQEVFLKASLRTGPNLRESLIGRRKCNGKVSPMSLDATNTTVS